MSDVDQYQIVIAGAGPAGSAAAAVLSGAGWRVGLLERDTFPRDKLCGEFLSGESIALLDRIGCLQTIQSYNPPAITQACFISTTGKRLQVDLPQPALGFSRRRLDKILFENACGAGVHGITGCNVRRIRPASGSQSPVINGIMSDGSSRDFDAGLVLAAYGRRSAPDRDLNRPFLRHLDSSLGIKLHHTAVPGSAALCDLASTTEIYGLSGGYCGISMIEDGLINVCMLLQRHAFAQVGTVQWPEVAKFLNRENAALGRRLAELSPVDEPVQTVSQMPFSMKDQSLDGILFVGDSAGMIAPLCGGGQAMALESGILLAEMIIGQCPTPEQFRPNEAARLGTHWQQQWKRKFGTRMRIGRYLQSALFNPAAANAAIYLLKVLPFSATAALARATRSA